MQAILGASDGDRSALARAVSGQVRRRGLCRETPAGADEEKRRIDGAEERCEGGIPASVMGKKDGLGGE